MRQAVFIILVRQCNDVEVGTQNDQSNSYD